MEQSRAAQGAVGGGLAVEAEDLASGAGRSRRALVRSG
jgi:hypothetical protein